MSGEEQREARIVAEVLAVFGGVGVIVSVVLLAGARWALLVASLLALAGSRNASRKVGG